MVIDGDRFRRELVPGRVAMNWNDGDWLFPKAVWILDVEEYRLPVLRGILLSIGSKTNSTQRPASVSLVKYANSLPPINAGAPYDQRRLANDLLGIVEENPSSNNIVVPVLQAFNVLLEADIVVALAELDVGAEVLKSLMKLATRNIHKLKSIQRVVESMKIVVNMLNMPGLRSDAVPTLSIFLQHNFPKVRADTAEFLYLVLQSKDIDYAEEADEILLETEWSNDDLQSLAEPTAKLLACFE